MDLPSRSSSRSEQTRTPDEPARNAALSPTAAPAVFADPRSRGVGDKGLVLGLGFPRLKDRRGE